MKSVRFFIFALVIALTTQVQAKKSEVNRIDPPYWWVGMNNTNLQLMVYGENIAETNPSIKL